MTEGVTSDLIQMLMDERHCSLAEATEAVFGSHVYASLLRPATGLYAQSSGYVYEYLKEELNAGK